MPTHPPLRLVIVGLGVHGRGIATTALGAGHRVVAAIDPFHVGKPLPSLVPGAADVPVLGSLAELSSEADLAVVAIKAPIDAVVGTLEDALRAGLDVITIVEDAYDLTLLDPALKERLDATARAAGRSVLATGVQDVAWVSFTLAATALSTNARTIKLTQHLGVDGYPEDFLRWVGIGGSDEEWEAAAKESAKTPSVFGGILPTIARSLGLTPGVSERDMAPFTLERDVDSVTFSRALPAGSPVGRRDAVTLSTEEGITLSAELVTSVVMGEDDFVVSLDGHPGLELRHRIEPSSEAVDATVINRLHDVVEAAPGLLLTADLPLARLRAVTPAAVPASA